MLNSLICRNVQTCKMKKGGVGGREPGFIESNHIQRNLNYSASDLLGGLEQVT